MKTINLYSFDDIEKYKNKFSSVTLTQGLNSVTGFLTSNFEFKVDAHWEPIINLTGSLKILDTVQTWSGSAKLSTGVFSTRFYKGASYFDIDFEFRVVDWNGTGNVVQAARTLAVMISPNPNQDLGIKRAAGAIIETAKELPAETEKIWDETKKAYNGGDGVLNSLGTGTAATVEEGANSAERILSKLIRRAGKGGMNEIDVSIGQYYKGPMIILEASVSYSKEMTPTGPLYADFKIRSSSRTVLNFDEIKDRLLFQKPGGKIDNLQVSEKESNTSSNNGGSKKIESPKKELAKGGRVTIKPNKGIKNDH